MKDLDLEIEIEILARITLATLLVDVLQLGDVPLGEHLVLSEGLVRPVTALGDDFLLRLFEAKGLSEVEEGEEVSVGVDL